MKNIFLLIPIVFVVAIITLFGCSKKRGCNIETACNYDNTAEKYDGSCTYAQKWYQDSDGDGFGDPTISVTQCEQPVGYVDNANGSNRLIAPDFNVADCDGNMHHLYSELDAKTIVVMAWVMPCSACIPDPLAAIAIVDSYSSTHPDRVVFYLADDYGDESCANLSSWANTYGMNSATKFSDASILFWNYGQPGMPKIIVMAGSNHEIYYDADASTVGLSAAIDQAISENP
ncbi:MAG: hypothetical protein CO118_12205 [Flavobacteriales bacterium CG_4_9_14_3_um_filter_32_8]|nr:MAG: hypothetical protein CO118_12205 [Flavobacteriales bacterium CG_4_9_14_3_um_filter_32_8]